MYTKYLQINCEDLDIDITPNFQYLSEWVDSDLYNLEPLNEAHSLSRNEIEDLARNLSENIIKIVTNPPTKKGNKLNDSELAKFIREAAIECCGEWQSKEIKKIKFSTIRAVITYCKNTLFRTAGSGWKNKDYNRLTPQQQKLIQDALQDCINFYKGFKGTRLQLPGRTVSWESFTSIIAGKAIKGMEYTGKKVSENAAKGINYLKDKSSKLVGATKKRFRARETTT